MGSGPCRRACRALGLLALLGVLCVAQALAQMRPLPAFDGLPRLSADDSLQAWRESNPAMRVGVVKDWRPIDIVQADGTYSGLSGDLLRALGTMLDLPLQVTVFDDFPQLLRAVDEGRIDVLASMARSPGREASFLFTDSYVELPVVFIGRRGVTDFSERHDFGGRRLVVERGHVTEEYLSRQYPRAALLLVDDTLQALQAVSEGRADIYLGSLPPAHHAIETHQIHNLEVLRTTRLDLGRLHLAVPLHARPLRDALNMALRRLDPQWLDRLAIGWQPRYLELTPQRSAAVNDAHRTAVARLGELRVGFDRGFGPINTLGEDGQPAGYAVELFRRAADAAGLRYRLLPQRTFETGLEAVRARELDIMLSAVRTEGRRSFARFVGPYYSAPSVLVSRLDGGWPSVASLAGRTLAIDRAHYLIPVIQREAPAVRLLEVETVETAMERVARGEADAMITNLEVAAGLINHRFLGQLQVSGTVEGRPSELFFMVRDDLPLLAEQLRAGLDAVPENERSALANTWLRTQFHSGVSWSRILLVVGPLIAVLLVALAMSLVYTRRLRAQVQARMAAEQSLQQERDAARAATAAKADFLAEMGHEVRNSLSSISAGLELLQRETLPGQARILVQAVARASARLVELLNNLLDVAKLEAHKITLHPEPVLLGQLVGELAEEFTPSAQARGLSLEVHGTEAWQVPVMLDPMRLRQILGNLVSNAIKFTRQGHVRIELEPPRWPQPRARQLVLHVRDSGIGMSPSVRSSLFERYAQAPAAAQQFGGTGLGLAIVRELGALMGAEVTVDSTEGQGSRFTLTMTVPEVDPSVSPRAQEVLHLATFRVLLVEDGEVNRLLYAEQLRQRGFCVEVCASAEAAWQRLDEAAFDLLVTDVQLPGESGADLALRVRTAHAGIGLIALSGEDMLRREWSGRFDLVLLKPCAPGDIAWLDALCRRYPPARHGAQSALAS